MVEGAEVVIERLRKARRQQIKLMWLRFKVNKAALISLYILVFLTVIAILAPYITPHDPYAFDLKHALEPPSLSYLFGRDEMGRDILSRIILGSRYSLGIAFLSVLIGGGSGLVLGLISGYYGGWIDNIIQRITDALLSFPTLILAIALVAVIGVGVTNVALSVGISTIPVYIRLTRGLVLQVKNQDYVIAARVLGKSHSYIIFKHILPNVISPVIVQSTYYMGLTILIASGLGFLGLGVQPPTPEWGTMIGTGRTYLFSSPHIVVFPGLFILITALCFNLIGDGLRDALDPRTQIFMRKVRI